MGGGVKDIKVFALSDVGKVREKNEDSFVVKLYDDLAVLVVADGMGGYLGGKAASEAVVDSVRRLFDLNGRRLPPAELIEDCLALSNRKIGELSRSRFEGLMVGSTVAIAVVRPPAVSFANLGDSRLYHFRHSWPAQMTTDHTMLQKLLEAGALKAEEAAGYAHKNIVYKSLNGDENLEIEPARTFTLEWGDVILLCSDGLSNHVRPEDMSRILQGTPNLRKAAEYMIALANHRGGDDNITVVLLEYGEYPRDKGLKLERIPRRKKPVLPKGRYRALVPLFALLAASIALLIAGLKDKGRFSDWLAQLTGNQRERAGVEEGGETSEFPREEPRTARILLRSKGKYLTEEEAKAACVSKGLFCGPWNPKGGFTHIFEEIDTKEAGFILDRTTGLMWLRKETAFLSFGEAENRLREMNGISLGGYSDWRLPTLEEAASLLRADPGADAAHIADVFPASMDMIWTADRAPGASSETPWRWCVDFGNGLICRMPESDDESRNLESSILPVRTDSWRRPS